MLDLLASLVDKSLVVTEINEAVSGSGKLRYRLLESTRQYAAEKLEGSGERDRLRRNHAEYFTTLARRAEKAWSMTPTRTWLPPLTAEIDNFRAALDWSLAEKRDVELGGALAGELWPFWRESGIRSEGLGHINAALAESESLSAPVTALLWLGRSTSHVFAWDSMRDSAAHAKELYEALGDRAGAMRPQVEHGEALTRLGRLDEAAAELTDALTFFRDARDQRWANYAVTSLARNALWRHDAQLARDRYAEALSAARSQGDDRLASVVLNNLAESEFGVGDTPRAIALAREVLAGDRNRREITSICFSLANLSAYLISIKELDEARTLANEALRKAVDVQLPVLIACSVQHLAAIATLRGEHDRAAMLLGFTNAIFGASIPRESTEQREYDSTIEALKHALGEPRVNELLRRGAATPQEQAVAEALTI